MEKRGEEEKREEEEGGFHGGEVRRDRDRMGEDGARENSGKIGGECGVTSGPGLPTLRSMQRSVFALLQTPTD